MKKETKSQTLIQNIQAAVIVHKADTKITQCNRKAQELLGLTEKQMMGKEAIDPYWSFLREDGTIMPIDEYPVNQVLKNKKALIDYVVGIRKPDKAEPTWVLVSAVPEIDGNGSISHVIITFMDITRRKKAEEELREKDVMLANIASQVPGMLYQFKMAPDGTYSVPYSSEGVRDIFGCSPEDVRNDFDPILNAIHPGDRDYILQTIDESVNYLSPWKCEYRVQTPGKPIKWIFGNSIPEKKEDGSIVWSGYNVDITERKQSEDALRQKHEMLKRTEAIAHVGSWEWEIETDTVNWSEELYRIFQLNPDDKVPNWVDRSKLYHPEDAKKLRQALETAAAEGKPYELELRAFRKDGETRICKAIGFPETGKDGKVVLLFGLLQDITDRKNAEKALKESERRYRTFVNSTSDLVYLKDENFRHLVANTALATFFQKKPEEVIGLTDFDLMPEEAAAVCRETDRKALETGSVFITEETVGDRVFESLKFPVKLENSKTGVGCYIRDITKRRQVEKERKQLQERLHQTQKMESIGNLAGGVAHDFNNMLSVILGNTEMAMDGLEVTQPLYDHLREIQKAAVRSTNVVRQLLAFARKQTIAPIVLNLNETVEEMLKMLHRLLGENIDLSWKPRADIWSVKIDPAQIDQILANLTVNARDAIADVGKLTIETNNVVIDKSHCANEPDCIPGEFVLLAVSDNGCGMDKETQKKLFEPFFSTKEVGKGTGLGLATVHGIVKQNRGFINVYSELDKGTTFKIYFPRYVASAEQTREKPQSERPAERNETILLVEDEPSIIKMTKGMLEKLGYQVKAANNPVEAIRIAQEHPGEIHLLITDVVMPEMNGKDLAEHILSLYPNLKRLFMSGYTADVIAHHGFLDEGINFIQKPFSREQLGVKVREVLDGE